MRGKEIFFQHKGDGGGSGRYMVKLDMEIINSRFKALNDKMNRERIDVTLQFDTPNRNPILHDVRNAFANHLSAESTGSKPTHFHYKIQIRMCKGLANPFLELYKSTLAAAEAAKAAEAEAAKAKGKDKAEAEAVKAEAAAKARRRRRRAWPAVMVQVIYIM